MHWRPGSPWKIAELKVVSRDHPGAVHPISIRGRCPVCVNPGLLQPSITFHDRITPLGHLELAEDDRARFPLAHNHGGIFSCGSR